VSTVYANYDVGSWEEDCTTNEVRSTADIPEWVDNATCNYTYTTPGSLTATLERHNDGCEGDCADHISRSECVFGEEYISAVDKASCVPTYACSDTTTVSRTNSHVLVDTELPPKINEIFYLDNNYNYSITWDILADKHDIADITRPNNAP
jgi:hypothetical protein